MSAGRVLSEGEARLLLFVVQSLWLLLSIEMHWSLVHLLEGEQLVPVTLDLQGEVVGEGGIEIRFVAMQVFGLLDLVWEMLIHCCASWIMFPCLREIMIWMSWR